MTKIDLGEPCGATCSPEMPKMPDKYYPTIHITREDSLNLPSEGEMTVEFKRKNETETTDEEGVTRYSCTIEVRSILSVKGETPGTENADDLPKNRGKATEDALDALVAAHKKSKESY